MKSVVRYAALAAWLVATQGAARAADATCGPLMQDINALAATISKSADAYWAHRGQFVELGRPARDGRGQAAGQPQSPQQHESLATSLRTAMPSQLANFMGLIASARSNGCASPSQLAAISEPTFKLAKRVNIDRFPDMSEIMESAPAPKLQPVVPKN